MFYDQFFASFQMSASNASHPPLAINAIIERYCLVTDDQSDSAKGRQPKLSAFVIRLTDASLKSLDEAISQTKREKTKAKAGYIEIQSNGNEGTLSFGGTASIQHQFSIMDAQRDLGPTGQLEAIAEMKTSKKDIGKRMKSIGSITKRLHIAATTRDTFESTKQKAKQADEEARKNAAKVLKAPASGVRKNVWDKITKAQAPTSQRPLTPMGHHRSESPAVAKKSTTEKSIGEVSKRKLRERILYRLITNPLSPRDLLTKLASEGISEEDRSSFDRVFNEVAQPKMGNDGQPVRAGVYEVKKTLLKEIKPDDWPYYTTWERQVCRRMLATGITRTNHQQHQSSANESMEDAAEDGMQRVKTKMAYRAPPPKQRSGAASEGGAGEPTKKSQEKSPSTNTTAISPSTAAAIEAVSAVTLSDTLSPPPRKRQAMERRDENGPTSGAARLPSASTTTTTTSTMPSFEAEYPPIRTVDERRRYKEEFDRDYPIYMEAYEHLRKLALEFERMGEKLKTAPKASTERQEVEKDILDKYKDFENSSEIKKWRRRHEELKMKLHVLKMRVKEFDAGMAMM